MFKMSLGLLRNPVGQSPTGSIFHKRKGSVFDAFSVRSVQVDAPPYPAKRNRPASCKPGGTTKPLRRRLSTN